MKSCSPHTDYIVLTVWNTVCVSNISVSHQVILSLCLLSMLCLLTQKNPTFQVNWFWMVHSCLANFNASAHPEQTRFALSPTWQRCLDHRQLLQWGYCVVDFPLTGPERWPGWWEFISERSSSSSRICLVGPHRVKTTLGDKYFLSLSPFTWVDCGHTTPKHVCFYSLHLQFLCDFKHGDSNEGDICQTYHVWKRMHKMMLLIANYKTHKGTQKKSNWGLMVKSLHH